MKISLPREGCRRPSGGSRCSRAGRLPFPKLTASRSRSDRDLYLVHLASQKDFFKKRFTKSPYCIIIIICKCCERDRSVLQRHKASRRRCECGGTAERLSPGSRWSEAIRVSSIRRPALRVLSAHTARRVLPLSICELGWYRVSLRPKALPWGFCFNGK